MENIKLGRTGAGWVAQVAPEISRLRLASKWLRILVIFSFALGAQEPKEPPVEFVCPMDPDVRSKAPGKCSRCGMKLEAGIPDGIAYQVRIAATPKAIRAGVAVDLSFEAIDPKNKARAGKFELVHDRLFHLFLVSEDLQYFAHEHPEIDSAGLFHFRTTLPKPGYYRVLSDFYPSGATPQMIASSLFVGGEFKTAEALKVDLSAQKSSYLDVELAMDPAQPIAGKKTMLFFRLRPGTGLEQYLGAWGHMLAASEDLVDTIHTHPAFGDEPPLDARGSKRVQFNLVFPRESIYRVWVQFQRDGKVNTVAFNIPVKELR